MHPNDAPPPPPTGGSQDPPAGGPPPPGGGHAPPPPGAPAGPRIPWEDREQLGFLNAFVETCRLVLTAPADAFSRLRVDGQLVPPLIFGLLVTWVSILISQIWSFTLGTIFGAMTADIEALGFMMGSSIVEALLVVVFWPILFLVVVFLTSAIYHVILMVVGALTDSSSGFEGTFKVVAYANVATLAQIIPVFGALLSLGLSIWFYTVGFSKVHRTTTGKALVAALLPIVLCCVCAIVVAIMSGVAIGALAGSNLG